MNTVKFFRGLNNVDDPMRLDLDWLTRADNVDISDRGALSRRPDFALSLAGSFTAAYSTIDYSRMYVVDGGVLKVMTSPTTAVALSSVATVPMYWAEINDNVYFNNGINRGIITPDNTLLEWDWPEPTAPSVAALSGSLAPGQYQVRVTYTLPDGRMTGSSDAAEITLAEDQALQISAIPQIAGYTTHVWIAPANSAVFQHAGSPTSSVMVWNSPPDELGRDLQTVLLDPLPANTDVIQAWQGRMYAAEYLPVTDQTVIWYSKPLGFHLFNLNEDLFLVPGRVLAMAPHDQGLIIGTRTRLFLFDGKGISQIANYGVIPGQCWARDDDDKSILLWTQRGVCRALPLQNLTADHVSVAPGVQAGAALVRLDGQKKFVASLHQGGTAFNQRS